MFPCSLGTDVRLLCLHELAPAGGMQKLSHTHPKVCFVCALPISLVCALPISLVLCVQCPFHLCVQCPPHLCVPISLVCAVPISLVCAVPISLVCAVPISLVCSYVPGFYQMLALLCRPRPQPACLWCLHASTRTYCLPCCAGQGLNQCACGACMHPLGRTFCLAVQAKASTSCMDYAFHMAITSWSDKVTAVCGCVHRHVSLKMTTGNRMLDFQKCLSSLRTSCQL